MKTTGLVLAIMLAAASCVLAAPPAAQSSKPQQEKRPRSAELDRLIKAIHLDLKALTKEHPWMAEYDDECLLSGDWIYYASRSLTLSQQPDHISISYGSIGAKNNKDDFKYWNVLEDVAPCRFPRLGLKIYTEIKVPDAKAAKAIRSCIIKRCEALHKELDNKQQKSAAPQQDLRGSGGNPQRG